MFYGKDRLPVYDPDGQLLYYATFTDAKRLMESGRAMARGTAKRVRSLVAMRDTGDALRWASPPFGQRFSHNRETPDNPQGVWTHSSRCLMYG